MSKKSFTPYFLIAAFLIFWITISPEIAGSLKGRVINRLAALWELFTPAKKESSKEEYIARIELENELLKQETIHLQTLVDYALKVKEDWHLNQTDALAKHFLEVKTRLIPDLHITPARVLSRTPASWNSTLWINIGSADNEALGRIAIEKNSPVIGNGSLIGVVDRVEKHQSQVRLITDPDLSPSVRALRDGVLLAKGELHGSSRPMWRSHGQTLYGIGFNYDFADDEGPARDLRTGSAINAAGFSNVQILKVNDLLVTTGFDGVFPAGLEVARVSKVHLLREGDYTYELEAKPLAGNLDDLSLVFVLPPIN